MKTSIANVLFGTNAANGLANAVQNTTAAGQKGLTNSFSETFSSTAGKNAETTEVNTTDVKQNSMVVENKPVREVSEVKEQPKNESLDKAEEISVTEEITEGAKQIIDKIKDEFEVSDEAIEEAMQVLNLSIQDLFNVSDLQNLIMEVTGTTDSIELITNDSLYKGMGEVLDFMNELKGEITEQFNITDEAFMNVVNDEQLFTMNNEIVNSEEANVNTDVNADTNISEVKTSDIKVEVTTENVEAPVDNDEVVVNPEIVKDDVKASETTTESKETVENVGKEIISTEQPVKETDNTVKVEVNVEDNETVNANPAPVKTAETNNSNAEEKHEGKNTKNENNSENVQTFTQVTTTTNTVGDVVQVVESYRGTVDSQEVMRQITEYMRVNISANSTSMEMQLHPASLGTVNMQVISQNGQVSAHFTVQNEAVKAVLETQLLTLQETLNEQGTKVSAIEVSVANYNLDKGSENQPNESNSNNQKKGYGKRSSIDLTSLESFDDLDEDEMIQAKVMEMNGNTVSYTV